METKKSQKKYIHFILALWLLVEPLLGSFAYSSSEKSLQDYLKAFEQIKTTLRAKEELESPTPLVQCETAPVQKLDSVKPPQGKKKSCIEADLEIYKKELPEHLQVPVDDTNADQKRNFLKYMIPLSIHFQEKYGIPADIHLSNAIIATSWGTNDGFLKYNNPFGIRCNEVSGPASELKCSPDGKFFHFENMYEAFDFYIQLVYFSDNYTAIRDQVRESYARGNKLIDRTALIPSKNLESPGLTEKEKSLIEAWNRYGGTDPKKIEFTYHKELNSYLKDWFSKIDYSKISICQESKIPVTEKPPVVSNPEKPSELPAPPVDLESTPDMAEQTLRDLFVESKSYGDYSVKNFRYNGKTFPRSYNPGLEKNYDDFKTLEGVIQPQSPLRIKDKLVLNSHFGHRGSKEHGGLDIKTSVPGGIDGAPLYSVGNGYVKKSGYSSSFGFYVLIQLTDEYGNETPFSVMYAHLKGSENNQTKQIDEGRGLNLPPLRGLNQAKTGDRVNANTIVGHVGSTGESTGPHLHFELLYQWEDINKTDDNKVFTGPYRLNPEFYPSIKKMFNIKKQKPKAKAK